MTTPQIKVGDRVRVEFTVGLVGSGGGLFDTDGMRADYSVWISRSAAERGATVEVITPPESWQPGDIVRNADDPTDKRMWQFAGGSRSSHAWVRVGANDGKWYRRDELPARLTLLVRDGEAVTP